MGTWYGKQKRSVAVVSNTAVWHSTGLPAVPLRWVLIRDPQAEFRTQALLCTDLRADPERIISWFVMRWQMEATFQEVRQRLGFETQRHWSQRAIQRTAPALCWLCSLWLRCSLISTYDQEHANSKTNGLVPQELSDLL